MDESQPADASGQHPEWEAPATGWVGTVISRGARQSLATQLFAQTGSMVATVILARLLNPGDFGIVALSQSILGFATLIALSGVNAAIVTRRTEVQVAASSYFWLALGVGLVGFGVFALTALPVTHVLGQPAAAPYVAVLAISFPLGMLSLVPAAMLQREFRFGWLNASIVASAGSYFALEIFLALLGWGAWAVIVGQVAGSAVGLLVSFAGARWRPAARFSWATVRSDISLTAGLGAGQALTFVQKNADNWAVSSVLGGPTLGIYYVAYVLPNIVRQRLTATLAQVLLPAYAVAESIEETTRLWRRTFRSIAGLGLPMLVGIALVAGPLVHVFFGGQWTGAVAPMRILTASSVIDLLVGSVATVAVIRRNMRRYVVVTSIRALSTTVFAFVAAITWRSTVAVALAVLASALITALVQEFILSRPMGIGLGTVARPLAGYVALTALMACAVVITGIVLPLRTPPIAVLATQVTVGVLAYIGVGWLVARPLVAPVVADAHRVLRGR